jgi:hypothetical protein
LFLWFAALKPLEVLMLSRRVGVYLASFVSVALLLASQGKSQQQISDFDRRRAQDILQVVAKEVRNHYYDITFHGLDWDAKVAEVKEKIAKTTSAHMAMSTSQLCWIRLTTHISFFLPPGPPLDPTTDGNIR